MTHSAPSHFRALRITLAFAGISCWSMACFAQTLGRAPTSTQPAQPSRGDTIRLTDQQRDAILNGNTVTSAAAARGELQDTGNAAAGIHGEIGTVIGSHGTRGVYGVAAIPLGDRAGAAVSFESSRFRGDRR